MDLSEVGSDLSLLTSLKFLETLKNYKHFAPNGAKAGARP